MKQQLVPIVGKPVCKQTEHVVVEELQTFDAIHRSDERVHLAAVADKTNTYDTENNGHSR